MLMQASRNARRQAVQTLMAEVKGATNVQLTRGQRKQLAKRLVRQAVKKLNEPRAD